MVFHGSIRSPQSNQSNPRKGYDDRVEAARESPFNTPEEIYQKEDKFDEGRVKDFSEVCSAISEQTTGCDISEIHSESEFSEMGIPVSDSGEETATDTDYGNIEKQKKNRQKKKFKGLKEVPTYTDAEVEKLAEA